MKAKRPVSKRFSNAVLWVILGTMLIVGGNAYATPEERTTFQEWSFPQGDYGPILPDPGWNNIFGDPCLSVGDRALWSDNAWALHTDEMDIFIPNYNDRPNPVKEIFVELTWRAAGLNFLPDYPIVFAAPVGQYDMITIEPGEDVWLGNQWTSTLFTIHIWPNPPSEWILIKGDIYVSHVLIDTYCIPEPGTLSLLGLSVLFGLKRRRGV